MDILIHLSDLLCCAVLCSVTAVLCCAVGQIKGETKALQTLAVVCSLLRHFAAVVVGVTRPEDEQYLAHTVSDYCVTD